MCMYFSICTAVYLHISMVLVLYLRYHVGTCIVFSVHNSNRRTISNLLERSRGILDSMVEGKEPEQMKWLKMFKV